MLPTNADQSYSHEKLRLAMGNNYQKWLEHAYVSIKNSGLLGPPLSSSYHNDRPFCNGLVYTFVWSDHLHADVPNHGSQNQDLQYCARLLAVIQPFALMCFVFYLFWTNMVTGAFYVT